MASEIDIFHSRSDFWQHLNMNVNSNVNKRIQLNRLFLGKLSANFWPAATPVSVSLISDFCFDFEIKENQGSREIELLKNQNKQKWSRAVQSSASRRKLNCLKWRGIFENSAWKFLISEAISKRFLSIKVGLSTLWYINSYKMELNDLKICLDWLVHLYWPLWSFNSLSSSCIIDFRGFLW